MKLLLIVVCLFGLAVADDINQAAASAVDESVAAFLRGAAEAESLSQTIGIEDPVLKQLADDIEAELGKTVKEAFEDLLEKIRENLENGKAVGKELLDKVKELRQKLKDLGLDVNDKSKETLQKVREKAKETLKKILERLGLGKRNIDDSMDQIARLYFRDIIDSIKEKLTSEEAIKKIRDYVDSLDDTPITREIKEFLSKITDGKLREVLGHLLEYHYGRLDKRAMGDTWNKIKEAFQDLNVNIQEHGKKFGEWLQSVWGKGLDQLRQKYGTVKAIAMEYISKAKDVSTETAQEALEFFRQYKDDLGNLWKQIVDATKETIGKF